MTNPDSRTVALEELALSSEERSRALGYDTEVAEAEVRELSAYGFDSQDETLVGIGPVERAERASRARREAASPAPPKPVVEAPESVRMPQSEPPGPFVASDDDELPPRLPLKKGTPWVVALTGVLVATAAVALVREIVPRTSASSGGVAISQARETAGLTVNVDGPAPHVFVDGQDRGAAPLRMTGLAPGPHVVSIVDPAYAPYSQTVTLTANRVSTVEPQLVFVRGVLRLSDGGGADGAKVEVIGASERREVQHLPATLEVPPGEYRVRGTRDGYLPFEATAALSAASPAVDVSVALPAKGAPETAVPSNSLQNRPGELGTAGPPKRPSASAAQGSLDITSSPAANVVLDGRPIGKAPRVVPVAPGQHTVVFVHPQRGRMQINVNVSAGHTTSASANF